MLTFLLLAVGVYGAAIVPRSSCLGKCFESRNAIVAADDLRNFKSIALDIDNFCKIYEDVLKCGQNCIEDLHELHEGTAAAAFVCAHKEKEFRLAKECLKDRKEEDVNDCLHSCGITMKETGALSLDSSPAALLQPAMAVDALAPSCRQHVCAMQCSIRMLNKGCPDSGALFKDIVRAQIGRGSARLQGEMNNDNDTITKALAENYWEKLPIDCSFLKSPEEYDKLMAVDMTKVTAPVMLGQEDSTEKPTGDAPTTMRAATTAELKKADGDEPVSDASDEFALAEALNESKEDEKDEKAIESGEIEVVDRSKSGNGTDLTDMLKVQKPQEPLVVRSRAVSKSETAENVRDATATHEFTPEDDFVPFGKPQNVTEEEAVTENPAVAMVEEDVKIAEQGPIVVSSDDGDDVEEEKVWKEEENKEPEAGNNQTTSESAVSKPTAATIEATENSDEVSSMNEKKEEIRPEVRREAAQEQKAVEPKEEVEEKEKEQKEEEQEDAMPRTADTKDDVSEDETSKLKEAMRHNVGNEQTTEAMLVVDDVEEKGDKEGAVAEAGDIVTQQPEMAHVNSATTVSLAFVSLFFALVAL